ncbi:hypothetical protein [Lactococcus formosensis]|uniref:hypothetical protein n=1 Tax=Lactococcus formosensis TaxID=1281486 RepID=UPI002435CC60|nr:hypothetical protein [Lactococcus formosensis]MDG6143479.1 hypothetical protein [Lactococcus formosensis]MDG6166412.1 hypothetical protein [Lactococcus formosensis]MDG6172912.1 hypothetical protein [Lactococcus formosensis]
MKLTISRGRLLKSGSTILEKAKAGVKGLVPTNTINDEEGDNIFSIIPNNQNIKGIKVGDTCFLKITDQNTFTGLVSLNVDIVK